MKVLSFKHYFVCHTRMFIIIRFSSKSSLSTILLVFHQEVPINQIFRYLINSDIGLIAKDWVHVHEFNLYCGLNKKYLFPFMVNQARTAVHRPYAGVLQWLLYTKRYEIWKHFVWVFQQISFTGFVHALI